MSHRAVRGYRQEKEPDLSNGGGELMLCSFICDGKESSWVINEERKQLGVSFTRWYFGACCLVQRVFQLKSKPE